MRRAIIDIGTNSTLFLSGELNKDKKCRSIIQRFNVTRLGERVERTGIINKNAMERTIEILAKYHDEIVTANFLLRWEHNAVGVIRIIARCILSTF